MSGLTLDTGALIALERKNAHVLRVVGGAQRAGWPITVPTVVVTEWWRGQRGPAARMLDAFRVEPLHLGMARLAGEALAVERKGASIADAIVMASAASRGDRVLTGDVDDLERLRAFFPAVRLIAV